MTTVPWWALVALLLLLGSCSDDGGGTHPIATASSPDQLVALYKQKHSEGDLEGLLALIHWDGVEDNVRGLIRGSLQNDIDHELLEARFESQPPSTRRLEYTRNGVVYRLNLRAVGGLVVRYSPNKEPPRPGSGRVTGSTYKLGVSEDGTYRITLAAPVGR